MTTMHSEHATTSTNGILQLVSFTVGGEEFGVDILKVHEIIRMVPITAMPNAPEYIEGVIDIRGEVIPVIDFRKRFHIPGGAVREDSRRIVIVAVGDRTMGMVVDGVSQVLKLPQDQISPAPPVTRGLNGDAISGVGRLDDHLLMLLNLDRMFGDLVLGTA